METGLGSRFLNSDSCLARIPLGEIPHGNVEKSRQRRSRPFAVLTYYEYAPRVKRAAALPVEGCVLARLGWAGQTKDFFEHSLPLTMWGSSGACIGY